MLMASSMLVTNSSSSGTIVELQKASEGLYCNKESTEEAIEEVFEMISEAENQVYKTSNLRMQRLTELNAMKVRDVKATNKSNAGLLRRYKREHEEGHKKKLLSQLETMQKALSDLNETEDGDTKTCFITQESSLEETKDVLEQLEERLKMEDIPWEKLFGLVGIPVSHNVQNYTDPMNIGINQHLKEVVASSECCLNQKSLWSLSGSKNSFVNLDNLAEKFGFKNKVTAVVPIKSWNHPTVWKAFHDGPLSKMVMGSQLRGAHIFMQWDELAFTTATLLRTVIDWASPKETEAVLMADLLDTIQFTDPRRNGAVPEEKHHQR